MRTFRFVSVFLAAALFAFAAQVNVLPTNAQSTCDRVENHVQLGKELFASGDYSAAEEAFACALEADPLDLESYRGQLEANLYRGAYAQALRTIASVQINVIPDNPDAFAQLISYTDALDGESAENLRVMTGYSFILWYTYDTQAAFDMLNEILRIDPENQYARVFRGSSFLFLGDLESGEADFAAALEQQPDSADLYFIIADAYLYGAGDVENSLANALEAQARGLDTPRLNAILGTDYFAMEEYALALEYFGRHIDSSTVETIDHEPLAAGDSVTIDFLPGQTHTFPVALEPNETLSLSTSSVDDVDTIMVLLTQDATLVTGNDDSDGFNAGFEWTADEGGTYLLKISTFEGAGTGEVILTRE